MLAVDLHCHSTFSDGCLPPEEVVERASMRGCKLFALTDHDTLDGLGLARKKAESIGIEFLNGVEVSVSWGKNTLHIVGLHVDPTNEILQEGLRGIRSGRYIRAKKMAQGLEKFGIKDALLGAQKYVQNPEMITRTHFARYLVEAGHVRNIAAVFKRFLVKGKPGYVEHEWASLESTIQWIKAAGGVAVLAHPGRYMMGANSMRVLLQEFIYHGGEAIEVVCGSHTANHVATFSRYAQEFNLLASVGSDYHATGEGFREPGTVGNLPDFCHPVWKRWYSDEVFQA